MSITKRFTQTLLSLALVFSTISVSVPIEVNAASPVNLVKGLPSFINGVVGLDASTETGRNLGSSLTDDNPLTSAIPMAMENNIVIHLPRESNISHYSIKAVSTNPNSVYTISFWKDKGRTVLGYAYPAVVDGSVQELSGAPYIGVTDILLSVGGSYPDENEYFDIAAYGSYAPDVTPPATPQGFLIENRDGGVKLSWVNVKDADLSGYNVYVDGSKANRVPVLTPYHTILGLTNGQTYSIVVKAVDDSGNESPSSTVITGRPSAEYSPAGITLTKGTTVADKSVVVGNYGSPKVESPEEVLPYGYSVGESK